MSTTKGDSKTRKKKTKVEEENQYEKKNVSHRIVDGSGYGT